MIAPRLLPRSEWEPVLRKMGCKPVSGLIYLGLESGEYWLTIHGRSFVVTIDNNEGMLRTDDFREVLANIERLKPID